MENCSVAVKVEPSELQSSQDAAESILRLKSLKLSLRKCFNLNLI